MTAWVTRFCHNISRRNKSDKREGALTLEEIVESEELWIRKAQRELRMWENYQQLVSKFGLQGDQKGVIRCKMGTEGETIGGACDQSLCPLQED